ncbi:hypothetical protein KEM52_003626, partial [Ascosphaera acerosa]
MNSSPTPGPGRAPRRRAEPVAPPTVEEKGDAGVAPVQDQLERITAGLHRLLTERLDEQARRLKRLEAHRDGRSPSSPEPTPDFGGMPSQPTRGVAAAVDRAQYRNWRPKDVGFFWPNAPAHMGAGDRVREKGATYYRTVTAFSQRVRLYVTLHPNSPLQENLDAVVEGTAQEWWSDAVGVDEQLRFAQQPDGIEAWLKRLEEHFAPSPEEAEALLDSVTYTPADAKGGRSVEEYMAMIRAATRAFNENAREGEM